MTTLSVSPFYGGITAKVGDRSPDQTANALQLFNQGLTRAYLQKAWRRLTGKQQGLQDLDASAAPANSRYAGVRPVPIHLIKGSMGRTGDFDANFRPMQERTRSRWVSVANAQLSGIALPPVDLIQVGEHYFVRDGHHRISVARALGQTTVDAVVTVW